MKACAHCGAGMADSAPRCLSCGVAVEGDSIGDVFRTVDKPLGEKRASLAGALIFVTLLLAAVLVFVGMW